MLTVNNVPQIHITARPVDDFVDNRLNAVDPIFNKHNGALLQASATDVTTLLAQQNQPVSNIQSIDSALDDRSQQFLSAVAAYGQSQTGKDSKALDLVKSSSWSDVLHQVEAAQRQYEGATKNGFLGTLRGRLRKFGECAVPVEAWLKLLPGQSWQGSLVCGGVLIILKVRPDSR